MDFFQKKKKKILKAFVQVNRGYRFQFQIKIDNPC